MLSSVTDRPIIAQFHIDDRTMIENPQIPLSEMPLFTPRPLPEKADVDIVPLLPLDAEAGLRVMVVTYMFTFDGKLDIERLRTSLYDLIKYKWRILGARLVYNAEVLYYISFTWHHCSMYLFSMLSRRTLWSTTFPLPSTRQTPPAHLNSRPTIAP